MGIILVHLHNDTEEVEQILPANIFVQSKSNLRTAISNLLANQIPEDQRESRKGDALLKKWFLSLNDRRCHMYYSKDALMNRGTVLIGARLSTAQSIDAMIDKIVKGLSSPILPTNSRGSNSNADAESESSRIRGEIIQKLLEKSFMKHLKGAAREHCQMGHKLELPIGKSWMKDVNEKGFLSEIKVLSLHKVGLVAKKNKPWAKDSIDFLAIVHDSSDGDVELWGVEIKSRQTNATVTKEREYMRRLHR